jgi:hypothetical protein
MRRRIRRHPQVAEDILDAAASLASDSMSVALRFLDSVEDTLHRLLEYPANVRKCMNTWPPRSNGLSLILLSLFPDLNGSIPGFKPHLTVHHVPGQPMHFAPAGRHLILG